MSRSTNTRPETQLQDSLASLGLSFELHQKDLAGTPDIVFRELKIVVFVHGCFWHRHANCRRSRVPKNNSSLWLDRLAANVERDQRALASLRAMGWWAFVIWECEIDGREREAALRISKALNDRTRSLADKSA